MTDDQRDAALLLALDGVALLVASFGTIKPGEREQFHDQLNSWAKRFAALRKEMPRG